MTDYIFRPPYNTPESRVGRPPRPRTERLPGMLIDRDVAVTVAQGEPMYVDVYRPSGLSRLGRWARRAAAGTA